MQLENILPTLAALLLSQTALVSASGPAFRWKREVMAPVKGAGPLLGSRGLERRVLEKRAAECYPGYYLCDPSIGQGCCETGYTCGGYSGVLGCCPDGQICQGGPMTCDNHEIDCGEFCCPDGTTCSKDSLGGPLCSYGESVSSAPVVTDPVTDSAITLTITDAPISFTITPISFTITPITFTITDRPIETGPVTDSAPIDTIETGTVIDSSPTDTIETGTVTDAPIETPTVTDSPIDTGAVSTFTFVSTLVVPCSGSPNSTVTSEFVITFTTGTVPTMITQSANLTVTPSKIHTTTPPPQYTGGAAMVTAGVVGAMAGIVGGFLVL